MAKIRITQIKSTIDRPKVQKLTIQALGLGRINKSKVVESNPAILGMIGKVNHLVNVTEVKE